MPAEPSDAACYAAVIEVLRGRRVALDAGATKMLSFMLGEPDGCDAEITPGAFLVRLGPRARPVPYVLEVAAGVVSYLLDGTELPATRVLTRQLGPTAVPALGDRFPPWRFDARHVRIEALIGRTVLRIRRAAAELDEPLPEPVIDDAPRYVTGNRACPRCGKRPDRFRVLRDGAHVCMLCGASSPAP